MLGVRKNLNRRFAWLSPVFVALGIAVGVICGNPPVSFAKAASKTGDTTRTSAVRREAAGAQFARAEEQRANLNGKPAEKRTLAEYKQVVASYRRVYLITPRAAEVVDSLLSVAELYTEMGDRFGRSYYQSAVDSYQFLVHEYPSSKYSQDAFLRIGKLQRDQLGDSAQATKTYQDFLKKYPHSPRKREAQESLAELALLQHSDAPAAENASPAASASAPPQPQPNAEAEVPGPVHGGVEATRRTNSEGAPRIRRITASANADATRITIDLEDTVQYSSARIANPDRIFFDLHSARLTPEVARGNVQVKGDLLTGVRVAQNQAGVVRVVLNVTGVKDYAASLLDNPPQLVIYLYSTVRNGGAVRTAKSKNTKPQNSAGDTSEDARSSSDDSGNVKSVSEKTTSVDPGPSASSAPSNAMTRSTGTSGKNSRAKQIGPLAGNADARPDLVRPSSAPQPTRDGQSTLTRALGLKIGRIVIDAGHGGHDTGTIGPTGLMEKDLCLDVALRLGKIIQQRLPGADIVYTRSDDTFIPLEERTNIANEAKADLFISIHANSSQDHAARGVETYYLNLKGSAEAMEVAARENASSEQGVHDLEDLVKKIARNEKIDESKELAEDIQDSLAKRMQKTSKTVKDRGVRKAPFVVLIGADMPSILTEISFLSNPADEKLLKQPEYRQRVAEGLYQGVASYLQSMNSMTLNTNGKSGPGRPVAVTPVEQSRNQR
jgi:N-acetylmuramoyl-L-alanine amidase